MERCDFASITKIMRDGLQESKYDNQVDFGNTLFQAYIEDIDSYPENSQLNRWLNGLLKLSPAITKFYSENPDALLETIRDTVQPCFSDSAMVVQQLKELLLKDASISSRKKDELIKEYPCENELQDAEFITNLLIFGMNRPFQFRDIRQPILPPSLNTSPQIGDYIFGLSATIPKPCKYFCGREAEIERIEEAFSSDSKVFLCGIPGIGKSEVAKAYAHAHKKDYTNMIYLPYSGDLRKDIAEMEFADDTESDSEDIRFYRHNRFLRILKEDTLLVIDNFNAVLEDDPFLEEILKYNCRILISSRCTYSEYTTVSIEEISDQNALFGMVAKIYSEAEKYKSVIEQIIQEVHSHTYIVELTARLLETGLQSPQNVLRRLQIDRIVLNIKDKIRFKKDGKTSRTTYYDHIRILFALFKLSMKRKEILRSMSLIPATGINAKLFAMWLALEDLNSINELVERGLIREKAGRVISMHPMIQEAVVAELKPSLIKCYHLIQFININCRCKGDTLPYWKVMFQTIENIIKYAEKDDIKFYLLFLEDAATCMDTYQYTEGIHAVIAELEQLLAIDTVGSNKDRALLIDIKAALESDPHKRIEMLEQAIALIPEADKDNALLLSNLSFNLASYYHRVFDYNQSQKYIDKATSIMMEYKLYNGQDGLTQLTTFALFKNDLGHPEEGIAILQKIQDTIKSTCSFSEGYANLLLTLSILHLSISNFAESDRYAKESLQLYLQLFPDNPAVVNTRLNNINILRRMLQLPDMKLSDLNY